MNQVAGILDLTLDSTRCPVPMHVTAWLYPTRCHVTPHGAMLLPEYLSMSWPAHF